MKNKKMGFIGVILGLVLLLLCGCGGGGGGGTDPAPTPSDPLAPPSDPVTPPSEPDDTVNKDPLAGFEIDGLNLEQPGRPAIASDGTSFLVVSATTAADGASTLIGTLVGALDDAPFIDTTYPDDWTIIANLQDNATSSRPAAIFNGTHYCVVFQDVGSIYAQLLDTSGNFVDGSKVTLSTGDGNYLPVMAYDYTNNKALVVWVKYLDKTLYYYDLYSTLITFTPTGGIRSVSDATSLLGDQVEGDQNEPAIAFDGTNYLVIWREWTDTTQDAADASDIYGARVGADGTVVGSEFAVSTAAGGQAEPQLAFNDTTVDDPKYLAVWSDLRNNATTGYDIYGTLISTTVAPDVNDNFAINKSDVQFQNFPTVTWDGSNFFVAWANIDVINLDPMEVNLENTGIFADFVTPGGIVNNPFDTGLHVSPQPAEGTLYIYPVVSDYLATWVELTLDGQSILGTWAIFQ